MTKDNSVLLKGAAWNNSYIELPEMMYSKEYEKSALKPSMVILNTDLAISLGLDVHQLESMEGAKVLSGKSIPLGAEPIAQAYAGHQFGYLNMLGDGRALLLGEIISNSKRYDIQLKGSGRTKYSRNGDGKAVLGPMLREFLISEAMYHLGIPTSRSLSVVETGESVYREQKEKGAVLTRIASSHIRFGTFQYASKDFEVLKKLADYTISRHYLECFNEENPYLAFFEKVVEATATLIAKWQLVGFVHGVMNTDNMSVAGETIDYGPCAFMDAYNAKTVFSSIDTNGRYSYGNQKQAGLWNLARFAEALLALVAPNPEEAVKILEQSLSKYDGFYNKAYNLSVRNKLGFLNENEEDEALILEFFKLIESQELDYTNTFRLLSQNQVIDGCLNNWVIKWRERLERQPGGIIAALEKMKRVNPNIIPRNHKVEEALLYATRYNDFSKFNKLHSLLIQPYNYDIVAEEYLMPSPKGSVSYRTYCGT